MTIGRVEVEQAGEEDADMDTDTTDMFMFCAAIEKNSLTICDSLSIV